MLKVNLRINVSLSQLRLSMKAKGTHLFFLDLKMPILESEFCLDCCTGSNSRLAFSVLICCVISSTYNDSISFSTNFGISFLFWGKEEE